MFIKYYVCDFSELCQFCCSAGVVPAWCVYTHWHKGKIEKDQSPEYFKILRKKTIFNEHPVCISYRIEGKVEADQGMWRKRWVKEIRSIILLTNKELYLFIKVCLTCILKFSHNIAYNLQETINYTYVISFELKSK